MTRFRFFSFSFNTTMKKCLFMLSKLWPFIYGFHVHSLIGNTGNLFLNQLKNVNL